MVFSIIKSNIFAMTFHRVLFLSDERTLIKCNIYYIIFQVLELLADVRRILEKRLRTRRDADSDGRRAQLKEVVKCLLHLLNEEHLGQNDTITQLRDLTVTKRKMKADDRWELPIKYEISETMSKYKLDN